MQQVKILKSLESDFNELEAEVNLGDTKCRSDGCERRRDRC